MDDFFADVSKDSTSEFSMTKKAAEKAVEEQQACESEVSDSTPIPYEPANDSNESDNDDCEGASLAFLPSHSPVLRKRKSGSAIQTILEVLFGGLAGVLVAYYGLAWCQGPAFDLPKFGLPWIEQLTAKPLKLDDVKKSEDAKKDGDSGRTATKQSETSSNSSDTSDKSPSSKKSSSESKSKPRSKSESKSQ